MTSFATLAVAAIALLGPLEHSLRNAEKTTLKKDLGNKDSLKAFTRLQLANIDKSKKEQAALVGAQTSLQERIGATVTVLGNPDPPEDIGLPLLQPRDNTQDDSYSDVAQAFRTNGRVYSFATIDGTQYAEAAIPFDRIRGKKSSMYVLAVRKSIGEIPSAVSAVRNAFITAALAGLVLTLILGIPLSARLVRRLRRLREAALEVAQEGLGVEVPVDRARDEVGDLARTLAVMQRRLQEQEEARRSFVATASHELRTPLTSLDGMLELLDDDLRYAEPDLEDARALLDRARAQSRRLGRLAADLLDLSRLDARVELRSEPVELGELSRAVMAEFEVGTADRRIAIRLDELGGPAWAVGDPGSIARIMRILVDNAVRVSPPDSELRITVGGDSAAQVTVADQGPGVPPEEREQIFRRFHRGRDTHGQAGFGLGLAIGRELAERMGGELVLEETDGPGARFTLRLQAAPVVARTLSPATS
ncbi:MAG TPA: HAMP domain-containing sensor histidine kinase [Solirubrobacteraceae bacterium]|nr:HAMP domain-containing sensor histidine kinase [Solirubrobacteraceae bacterium]